ncbi:acyl carrier protein 2, chloroplastic [Zea mays]|uniref:acyl carrier protein 2, chloroplastic n=1 Tax=Zea mays TaxID=4577 RepID=UPI0009AA0F4D|nr:acyl carrier protein 2, chloroplastic [Zea mays]|eukprot:XP_020401053.1 acyl carrier protein 2, chloroplastic [Zea mays]
MVDLVLISYDVIFGVSQAISIKSVSFSGLRKDNVAFRLQPVPQRFAVCCPAKKETVDRVCDIVKKQLALPEGTEVCGSSKFQDLGADSLDTVEIVMGLEEAFKITVEESSAQSIATVEDAANLISDNQLVPWEREGLVLLTTQVPDRTLGSVLPHSLVGQR